MAQGRVRGAALTWRRRFPCDRQPAGCAGGASDEHRSVFAADLEAPRSPRPGRRSYRGLRFGRESGRPRRRTSRAAGAGHAQVERRAPRAGGGGREDTRQVAAAVAQAAREAQQQVADHAALRRVHDHAALVQQADVDLLLPELDGPRLHGAHPFRPPAAARVEALPQRHPRGSRRPGPRGARRRIPQRLRGGDCARLRRHVAGLVGVHADHAVGDVQVVAGAAHHQHRRHAALLPELPHAVDEGRDRFLLARHQAAHARVADHEVGGRRVLVDQQPGGAGLQGFHDGRRLGGAAGGIVAVEAGGVAPQRQGADERRQAHAAHRAAILGAHAHQFLRGDAALAAVAGQVIVDPERQRLQQGRLAVVAAAHDQRDPGADSEAAQRSGVWRPQLHRQCRRRLQRPCAGRMRTRVGAAAPRQHAVVGQKRDQPPLAELSAQGDLVLHRLYVGAQAVEVQPPRDVAQRLHRGAGPGGRPRRGPGCAGPPPAVRRSAVPARRPRRPPRPRYGPAPPGRRGRSPAARCARCRRRRPPRPAPAAAPAAESRPRRAAHRRRSAPTPAASAASRAGRPAAGSVPRTDLPARARRSARRSPAGSGARAGRDSARRDARRCGAGPGSAHHSYGHPVSGYKQPVPPLRYLEQFFVRGSREAEISGANDVVPA